MSMFKESYVDTLRERPPCVTIAKAIQASWATIPDEHSTTEEAETDWDKCSPYLQGKFLIAADWVFDTMHWAKIIPKELEEEAATTNE